MAGCLTLLLRDIGAPMPTYQVMAYPIVDSLDHWPSYSERGSGYILDRDQIKWFFQNYVPATHDPGDPYLFPLAARDLSGLPPSLVMTAEFDPLRDEGIAYTKKLAEAGVRVEHEHAGDQMRGFPLQSRAIAKMPVPLGAHVDPQHQRAGAQAAHPRVAASAWHQPGLPHPRAAM